MTNHSDHTHTWTTHMEMLTKKIRGIKMGQQCVKEIQAWYIENGKYMPRNWMMKDPEWWVEYKKEQERK